MIMLVDTRHKVVMDMVPQESLRLKVLPSKPIKLLDLVVNLEDILPEILHLVAIIPPPISLETAKTKSVTYKRNASNL
jgi:hypothetical protein